MMASAKPTMTPEQVARWEADARSGALALLLRPGAALASPLQCERLMACARRRLPERLRADAVQRRLPWA